MRKFLYTRPDRNRKIFWVKDFRTVHGAPLKTAVKAFNEHFPDWTVACDILSDMDQQIRIAIDIEQQTEEAIPIRMSLKTADGDPVDVFASLEDSSPVKQPVEVDGEGGRVFITEGGKYVAEFKWTASDGNEREFESEIDIPVPPYCPNCEQRVPEIPEDDYICARCRYG